MRWRNLNIDPEKSEQTFAQITVSISRFLTVFAVKLLRIATQNWDMKNFVLKYMYLSIILYVKAQGYVFTRLVSLITL